MLGSDTREMGRFLDIVRYDFLDLVWVVSSVRRGARYVKNSA